MNPHVATWSPKMTQNMIGSLSMADIEDIEMELYAGLSIIALCVAFIVVRLANLGPASRIANEKVTGSQQAQLKSQRRKWKTFGASSTAGSRFGQADKAMTMARGAAAVDVSINKKPWGW